MSKRPLVVITINGIEKSIISWARTLDIPADVARARLKLGWTPEQAFELVAKPPRHRVKLPNKINSIDYLSPK